MFPDSASKLETCAKHLKHKQQYSLVIFQMYMSVHEYWFLCPQKSSWRVLRLSLSDLKIKSSWFSKTNVSSSALITVCVCHGLWCNFLSFYRHCIQQWNLHVIFIVSVFTMLLISQHIQCDNNQSMTIPLNGLGTFCKAQMSTDFSLNFFYTVLR